MLTSLSYRLFYVKIIIQMLHYYKFKINTTHLRINVTVVTENKSHLKIKQNILLVNYNYLIKYSNN